MKNNRLLPLLAPLSIYLLLQVYFFWPKMMYLSLAAIILIFLFLIRQFIVENGHKERWWNLFFWPACLILSLVVFSTLIPNGFIIQILFLFAFFMLSAYFKTVYFYLVKTKNYRQDSLENLSSYGNFLSFYFAASAIYGFQVFLSVDIRYLMAILLVFTSAVVLQVFWANRIGVKENLYFLFIIVLVMVELAWAASFLTLSFYILGMIIAVSYYMLIGMVRFYILGNLNARLAKLYLIFGFLSITAVLLTSRWLGQG
jgi:hypothetical protein